ncbi:MAG: cupin domain-containing protein [Alphaproteobacteria bacterium]|nr:cupin domain-containing protein [Alphaproteobacteria bacterium]
MDGTATTKPAVKFALSRAKDARVVPGRREFFQYRDLGVTDATDGKLRAQLTSARAGMNRPTGWHYHVCEAQFVYMVKGWMELEFEGQGVIRLEPGDSVLIPGGLRHNEIGASDDFELIEASIPAAMDTVACEGPSR